MARRAADLEATLRAALADVERILAQRDPGFAERLARRQAQKEAA
ncbi:MAG: hypothetical protein QJR02_15945 [Sinobacteraceae bacterium]|nr:hypothetical protein [Nevskiaceae bacterium]